MNTIVSKWALGILLLLGSPLCLAQAPSGPLAAIYVDLGGVNGGTTWYTPAQLANALPSALIPPIADSTFICNNTGASAVPYQCSIGTGLQFSGGVLSNSVAPYTFSVSAPNSRTLSFSTAYQASTTSKAASVNINLTSTASISITGGSTNTATVYMGSTTAVASGTGTAICVYSNSNTGTLTIGLNLSTVAALPCHFDLPAGWYFAVLQSSGTVTITSAFDQSLG